MPQNIKTIYGRVNKAGLNKRRESFETMRILRGVDAIDEIRYDICEPDRTRRQLLLLHSMAHTLINDADLSDSSGEDISDMVEELSSLVFDCGRGS